MLGPSSFRLCNTNVPRASQSAQKYLGAPDRIELGLLSGLIGYQLRLAQIAIFRDFAESLGRHEITPGLFGVLVIIEANPGLKQTELARATHLDRSTVVTVIDNLEKRGLVERRAAAVDRRSNALQLTAEGTVLLRRLKRMVTEHEKRLAKNLSENEQASLVRLLQKIFPEHR
jgi:DNA-binding MarR family transcriptional regulator